MKIVYAAEAREIHKTSKYSELAIDYWFVPVGLETYGSWGPEGLKLLKAIGNKVMAATGEKRSTFFLSQSISIAIQRGNASCVIGTMPQSEGWEEIFEFICVDPPLDGPPLDGPRPPLWIHTQF